MIDDGSKLRWGEWVKKRSKFLGLKLSYVAEEVVGTSARNFSKWLSRDSMPQISKEKRKKLADALRIDPIELATAHRTTTPEYPGHIPMSLADDEYRNAPTTPEEAAKIRRSHTFSESFTRTLITTVAWKLTGNRLKDLELDALKRAEEAGLHSDELYEGVAKFLVQTARMAANNQEVDGTKPKDIIVEN